METLAADLNANLPEAENELHVPFFPDATITYDNLPPAPPPPPPNMPIKPKQGFFAMYIDVIAASIIGRRAQYEYAALLIPLKSFTALVPVIMEDVMNTNGYICSTQLWAFFIATVDYLTILFDVDKTHENDSMMDRMPRLSADEQAMRAKLAPIWKQYKTQFQTTLKLTYEQPTFLGILNAYEYIVFIGKELIAAGRANKDPDFDDKLYHFCYQTIRNKVPQTESEQVRLKDILDTCRIFNEMQAKMLVQTQEGLKIAQKELKD